MEKNQIVNIEITAMSSEGMGIGRYQNMAVFIPATAIGDTVQAVIVKCKKNYAYGKALNIVVPAATRIQNTCAAFPKCGGCVYRHISYAAECEIKQEKVFSAINRIAKSNLKPNTIIAAKNEYGYRNKAQYPISENLNTGFFATHSHRVIECENCALQPPEFAKICSAFSAFLKLNNISVYNEQTGKGLIRHLYLRKAAATNEIMAVAVINGKKISNEQGLIAALTTACGNIVSIQINENTQNTNVILGEKFRVIYGKPTVTDILCGIKVRISPLSFYQVNRDMAEVVYKKAAELAKPENKIILDLYCGAGTIGLSMARQAKKVIGVEIVADAVSDAEFNASLNGITNAEFICADAAAAAKEFASRNLKPDAVILDPPRKGCEAALLNIVAKDFAPERIVYVSCDPATLARDCAVLFDLGYKLTEYTPVDLFPRTSHVETVALLTKAAF